MDMGCPGRFASRFSDEPDYVGRSFNRADPTEAFVYGDWGQFQACPVACGTCPNRLCDDWPCENQVLNRVFGHAF
eukprot:SAG31_NODE_194_length_20722_cov_19.854192_22_plen_75_part_00